jgi:ERF superfamily protein
MAAAQGEIRPAAFDSKNPHFRSRYSSLTAIWDCLRGPMSKHGLCVWQDVTTNELGVSVTTRISHGSGQWCEFGPLTIPVDRKNAQGIGAAITYAKRFTLAAAIGIVSDEDDDGNGVSKVPEEACISDAQVKYLTKLMNEDHNRDELEQMLQKIGIQELSQLPVSRYDSFVAYVLNRKKEKTA